MSQSIQLAPSDSQFTLIENGWFYEASTMWPGQRMGLKVEEVLLNGKSDFQDMLVFQSSNYGKVLVLDGVIQVTERDEFSYQEMITHLPLFAHPCPKKVLIIGGGDGGVLREVVKHPSVETIHMCEIDSKVVEVGKHFFRESTATAFDDSRLTLMFDDAARYLREEGRLQGYDVIICDSSDPVGPAETLFQPEFFLSLHGALNEGGIVCTQGECLWLHLDLISNVMGHLKNIFSSVRYAYTTIPTYPSGQIGFFVAGRDESNDLSVPKRSADDLKLKYYSSKIHEASFVLPSFASERLL